jgi:hypothetical protein
LVSSRRLPSADVVEEGGGVEDVVVGDPDVFGDGACGRGHADAVAPEVVEGEEGGGLVHEGDHGGGQDELLDLVEPHQGNGLVEAVDPPGEAVAGGIGHPEDCGGEGLVPGEEFLDVYDVGVFVLEGLGNGIEDDGQGGELFDLFDQVGINLLVFRSRPFEGGLLLDHLEDVGKFLRGWGGLGDLVLQGSDGFGQQVVGVAKAVEEFFGPSFMFHEFFVG